MPRTVPDWFTNRLRAVEGLTERVGILIVVNVQGRTDTDDYVGDSVISEFLSATELDDLVETFASAGIYCDVIQDESGFLDWLMRDGISKFPRPHVLVYNLAQSGTGPARLSLVPGLCRLYRVPLVDSDAYAVSIVRHKFHTAAILRQCSLPAARSWWLTEAAWLPESPPIGLKVIAKPTYESASIGIDEGSVFVVDDNAELMLRDRIATYRQPLTVQEFIPGYEVEVPVFEAEKPETIVAVGIQVGGRRQLGEHFLKYADVAQDKYSFYDFDEVDPDSALELRRVAGHAFRALGLAGVGRIDFRVREDGSPVIIEAACKPHLTRHSSFRFAVQQIGSTYSDLVKFFIGAAIQRHKLTA